MQRAVFSTQQRGYGCEKKGDLNSLNLSLSDVDRRKSREEAFHSSEKHVSGAKWMEPRRMGCDVGESLSFCLNARGADRGDTFAAYTRLYLECLRYRSFSTHDTTSLF